MRRAPSGSARSTYSRPCPGCMKGIFSGDVVKKVTLKGQSPRWWHEDCRRQALETLRAEYQD